MQSVMKYIEQSRAGYAQQIVSDAVDRCGADKDDPAVARLLGRVETYLLLAMTIPGLDDPRAAPTSSQDVADAAAGAEPPTRDEPEPDGAEVLEKNPPPRLPSRRK